MRLSTEIVEPLKFYIADNKTKGFERIYREESVGSPRRCGGQGDLLNGALAIFSYWALRKNDLKPMISAGIAASQLIRWAAKVSFERNGRSSTASDMIAEIPGLIRLCEP
ncbi:ATP-dependent NAD(P)HX dehydratase [Dirofilaria immitis]|nr:ATP-dependent NAD(P)HX dehydratase [Dirofilaria immitis]